MIYLSQILNKNVYYQGIPFGKLMDLAISENRPVPPVSKLMILHKGKKITVAPSFSIENNHIVLKTQNIPFLPYDENDFYLHEDLLDKQVIDIDGRRVVRVNDVLFESNGELKVVGIDIGFSGILRRLGIGKLFHIKSKTLPWTLIEAFDYRTGSIRIKLTEDRLNAFHPAELADILEEVGTKERLAIVDVLGVEKAAEAIEETDTQTQSSIIKDLNPARLGEIANKMLLSKIADIFYKMRPTKVAELLKSLGTEKATGIERLTVFPENTAGGLMDPFYFALNSEKTVKEALLLILEQKKRDETIIVTNGNEKLLGFIYLKDFLGCDPLAVLKDIISEKKFVASDATFSQILKIFSQYNLHVLPVVNKDKKVLGVISIDTILAKIEEQKEKNDIL
ncbi:MAG: CBS domain-containing protein [Candidatus Levyibacteriota bacterium]